jgi:hypothetical protein
MKKEKKKKSYALVTLLGSSADTGHGKLPEFSPFLEQGSCSTAFLPTSIKVMTLVSGCSFVLWSLHLGKRVENRCRAVPLSTEGVGSIVHTVKQATLSNSVPGLSGGPLPPGGLVRKERLWELWALFLHNHPPNTHTHPAYRQFEVTQV